MIKKTILGLMLALLVLLGLAVVAASILTGLDYALIIGPDVGRSVSIAQLVTFILIFIPYITLDIIGIVIIFKKLRELCKAKLPVQAQRELQEKINKLEAEKAILSKK